METHIQSQSVRARGWTVVFGMAAVEGLAALLYLAGLPADAENALLLGFSARRLALMAALVGCASAFGVLAGLSLKPGWRERWLDPARSRVLFNALLVLLPLGAAASFLILLVLAALYRGSGDFAYSAYHERLLPLLAWAGLVCLQSAVWLGWAGGFHWPALRFQVGVFRAAAAALGLFALAWVFVALTGIGITPDIVGWGEPAVPLLEWQIGLAGLGGALFLLYLAYRRWPDRRDWIVAGALWLLAAGLWLGQPVRPAFFATAGRLPNNEIYPFSDGAYYGLFAQSVLIGNGFKGGEIAPRPLYITLLAGFHGLAGQEYEDVIALQTLLLACFPVVLFFIGRELHSRPAGLVAALWATLREVTAIAAAPFTEDASTSQLFFADLPAALAIALWALLAIRWLKAPARGSLPPLLAGGALGLAMLVRTQSLFMLPPVLLLALLGMPRSLPRRWAAWLRTVGWALLGLLLAVAPWLWRNWYVTGQVAFDDPRSQSGVMLARYILDADGSVPAPEIRPGEEPGAYAGRVRQGLLRSLATRPGPIARFVSAHFLNAEISNLLLMPVRHSISSPGELLAPDWAFWESWAGAPSSGQALLMALNLSLIALGSGAGWARLRWAGMALLLMNFSYNFSHALARNSGWRYLLPVDWMVYMLAAVGLVEAALAVLLVMGVPAGRLRPLLATRAAAPAAPASGSPRRAAVLAAGAALLLTGSLLPLVEVLVPRRYPEQPRPALAAEFIRRVEGSGPGLLASSLESFVEQPETVLLKGRALYPRFYAAGEGEPQTAKTGYEPLPYPRTLFQLASNEYYGLVVLRADQPPDHLPNAADVIVLGCLEQGYLDARAVLVLERDGSVIPAGEGIPARCP
jgi:hypothetical protein